MVGVNPGGDAPRLGVGIMANLAIAPFIGMPGAFTSLLLQGVGPTPGPPGMEARQSRIDLNKGTEMRPATTGHHNERKPSGSDAGRKARIGKASHE